MYQPIEITLHQKSRILELSFSDGTHFKLPCEFLRVYSPSAEVKGHGPGQEVLQLDKENVSINAIEAVGQYAVQLVFDDGHDSGLYTWDYLHELGENHQTLWLKYLAALKQAGHQRRSVI